MARITRSQSAWADYCEEHITAGYTPGGQKRKMPVTGVMVAEFLRDYGLLYEGVRVLDVGCGNGRLAMGLSQIADDFEYYGLEVIEPCVRFCRQAFKGDGRFRFWHLDIKNDRYWPDGRLSPNEVVYPLPARSVDTVIAMSLFSHTATIAVAQRNLAEMRRVLKADGDLFATWSFTTQREATSESAKHTIYHVNEVLRMYGKFYKHMELVVLPFKGVPNQVGIWTKR